MRSADECYSKTPGAIGHHLRVLEKAGLIQVVARRITRGIVASYYTRTARIFLYDMPNDVSGISVNADIVANVLHAELIEALESNQHGPVRSDSFPHVRISLERAMEYRQRLDDLLDDLLNEQPDPHGQIYGIDTTIFLSPPYRQVPEDWEDNGENK